MCRAWEFNPRALFLVHSCAVSLGTSAWRLHQSIQGEGWSRQWWFPRQVPRHSVLDHSLLAAAPIQLLSTWHSEIIAPLPLFGPSRICPLPPGQTQTQAHLSLEPVPTRTEILLEHPHCKFMSLLCGANLVHA